MECLLKKIETLGDEAYERFRLCLEKSEQRDVVKDYLPAEPLTGNASLTVSPHQRLFTC